MSFGLPYLADAASGSSGRDEISPAGIPFDIRVSEAGKMVLVRVDGPLDIEHAADVLSRVRPCCERAQRVVLDLRRSHYLDSTGVRSLLQLQEVTEAAGGELRLVLRPESAVHRTLSLLRLEERFRIYDNASDAWIRRSA